MADHYVKEIEAIRRMSVTPCRACEIRKQGEAKGNCPDCLERIDRSVSGKLLRGLRQRCVEKHTYAAETGGWECLGYGPEDCQGTLLAYRPPTTALDYLIRHPNFVSLKQTNSGLYQAQWTNYSGAGESPILALEAAIINGLAV